MTAVNAAQRADVVTTGRSGKSGEGWPRIKRKVTIGIPTTEVAEIQAVRRGSLGTSAARVSRTAFRMRFMS
jgi:hypothetical protein